MSFSDSGAYIDFSYRHRDHFCMFITGKVGSGTDNTIIDIALIMEDSASSRSSPNKLHVFPRWGTKFAIDLSSIPRRTRFAKRV